MNELGKIYQLIIPIGGHTMVFNLDAIIMAWLVIIVLIVFGFFLARKKALLPGSLQLMG